MSVTGSNYMYSTKSTYFNKYVKLYRTGEMPLINVSTAANWLPTSSSFSGVSTDKRKITFGCSDIYSYTDIVGLEDIEWEQVTVPASTDRTINFREQLPLRPHISVNQEWGYKVNKELQYCKLRISPTLCNFRNWQIGSDVYSSSDTGDLEYGRKWGTSTTTGDGPKYITGNTCAIYRNQHILADDVSYTVSLPRYQSGYGSTTAARVLTTSDITRVTSMDDYELPSGSWTTAYNATDGIIPEYCSFTITGWSDLSAIEDEEFLQVSASNGNGYDYINFTDYRTSTTTTTKIAGPNRPSALTLTYGDVMKSYTVDVSTGVATVVLNLTPVYNWLVAANASLATYWTNQGFTYTNGKITYTGYNGNTYTAGNSYYFYASYTYLGSCAPGLEAIYTAHSGVAPYYNATYDQYGYLPEDGGSAYYYSGFEDGAGGKEWNIKLQ